HGQSRVVLRNAILQFPAEPKILLSFGFSQFPFELTKKLLQFSLPGDFDDHHPDLPDTAGAVCDGEAVVQSPVMRFDSGRQHRIRDLKVRGLPAAQHPTIVWLRYSLREFSEDLTHFNPQVCFSGQTVDLDQTLVDGLIPQLIIKYCEADLRSVRESCQQPFCCFKRLPCDEGILSLPRLAFWVMHTRL